MKFMTADLDTGPLHELLGRAIAPLPVALISTIGKSGVFNAAPFSMVAPISWKPPIVCVSFGLRKGLKKHTQQNIEFAGDFVINIMDEGHIKPTVQASADYPEGVDEIKEVGLTAAASDTVKSPRIAEAQASFECRVVRAFPLGEGSNLRSVVLGEIIVAHVKDDILSGDAIDPRKIKSVGRIGTGRYCRTNEIFELTAGPIKRK